MVRKDRTGEEIEDVDDATDVEHAGKMLPFSPEQAMEISVSGARLTREIALLIKREEKHVKIVTKCREDRKAKIRELIQLWEDHQKGQQRLDFPDNGGPAPADAADPEDDGTHTDDGEVWSLIHGGRRIVCKRLAEGSWAALVDGRLVGDGLEDARAAKEFILADLGVSKQLWSSMKWVATDLPGDDAAPAAPAILGLRATFPIEGVGADVVARVWRENDGWHAEIGGGGSTLVAPGGVHPSKAKAQRACVKTAEHQYPGAEIPKLEWSEEQPDAEDAPADIDAANVEYGAKVGRKAAVLRQEEGHGKWTGRIGGTPIAVGLPLDEAKRLCEDELTKGKKDAKVEWIRTETGA